MGVTPTELFALWGYEMDQDLSPRTVRAHVGAYVRRIVEQTAGSEVWRQRGLTPDEVDIRIGIHLAAVLRAGIDEEG